MAAHGEQRATLIDRHSYRSPADRPPVERPIRLGVIGLGPRGRGNVVGKALAYAEYELAAVCDRRANIVGATAAAWRYHAVRHDVAAQHHALREFYWPRYRKWVLADTDRIRRLLQRNEPGAEVLAPAAWAERSIRRRRDDECTDRGGHAPRRPEPRA